MEPEIRNTVTTAPPVSRLIMRIACRYVEGCKARAVRAEREGREAAPVPTMLDATLCLMMALRNGLPLDLEAMLKASGDDLDHDVGSIIQHVDRRTGKVGGLFYPRLVKAVTA